ncbi:ubiquitin carboxyl-terminal hydrolase 16-like isoform X1 [Rhodamnia argentea]|uniref:ubiquitinyl hydrolase 1 n=1 Tax=Rhodamnia argentea TaxID=178133 RepID=A0A8B8P3N1_9MYRT|nr:ubiquitin carboxyl-terminal hydrolase 16-like isoform X1 [Rhodamnia argentea]
MLVAGDLGFSSLVLVVCFALPVLGFFVRRKWSLAAAKSEEIKRLLVLASEEAARAEIEASASYGNPSPPASQGYYCAVCYCPTTTRCARCKAVRYCSGKCQIIHWRQGHKEECRPVEAGSDFDGKDNRSRQETYYGETFESKAKQCAKPNVSFSDECVRAQSSCSELLRAKDDKISVELHDVNYSSESSDASSGFSSSATNSDSSDDTSGCESINSDGSGRLEEPLSSDIAHKISSTGGIEIKGQAEPLSPKFASLVDSLGSFRSSSKLYKSKSGCFDDQVLCTSSSHSNSGCSGLHEDSMAEPSRHPSGFWNTLNHPRNVVRDESSPSSISKIGACGKPDSGSTLRFSFNLSNDTLRPINRQDFEMSAKKPESRSALSEKPNADGLSAPKSSTKSEWPSHVADEGCSDSHVSKFSADESLSSVKADVPSSKTVPSSKVDAHKSKCSDAGCILPSDLDVHGFSGSDLHSTSRAKFDKDCEGQTHAPLSSHVAARLPTTKNGLKTSVWRVLDQFKGSVMSKHHRLGVGSDIPGRCNDKGIFPYELFVTLYTWKGVEFHPRGLINCGNSCYANAVLQCLAFTPPLTAYFLQGLHSKACFRKDWCFTCEFESLILRMNEGKSPISPIGIVSHLRNIGRQLGNGKEEDAHEFLRCAIDKMQSDCLLDSGKKVCRSKEEATLIGLTFGGYLRSKIQCTRCNGKSERHERMMDLTVEIGGDIRTLEEALRQFTSTETLDGENKYQCTRCNSYEKARKKLSVLEAPNILTIALKRFQSGKFGKLNKSIRFSEILDLSPFMKGTSDRSAVYRLYGVIVHLDIMNAAFSGHYVCYVKNMHNKWFKIDDSTVKPVELERVLTKGAYMLLYARCLPHAPRSLKHSITSADPRNKPMNFKSSGKSATPKSGLTNLRNNHHSSAFTNDSASAHSFDSDFNPLHRYHREDSLSDVSSLFSSNSDEGSCSTISTQDSPSYDDLSDYIFGDSGSNWRSSPWSNPSESGR